MKYAVYFRLQHPGLQICLLPREHLVVHRKDVRPGPVSKPCLGHALYVAGRRRRELPGKIPDYQQSATVPVPDSVRTPAWLSVSVPHRGSEPVGTAWMV